MSEVAKMDVHNTKELLVFLFVLGGAVKEAKADGKINALDLGLLLKVIPTVGPAFEDIDKIPGEFKDLEDAETAELLTLIGAKITGVVTKEVLLLQINKGLLAAKAVAEFIKVL